MNYTPDEMLAALNEWLETKHSEPISKAIVALQGGLTELVRERDALRKAALPIVSRVSSNERNTYVASSIPDEDVEALFFVMRKQKQI